jgi:hypothetical protein
MDVRRVSMFVRQATLNVPDGACRREASAKIMDAVRSAFDGEFEAVALADDFLNLWRDTPKPVYLEKVVVHGDQYNIRDVTASAVGPSARLDARDIKVFIKSIDNSQALQADTKDRLKRAREEIDKLTISDADKSDAQDDLGKLTEELEKPQPAPNRVKKFLDRLAGYAEPLGTLLGSAVQISSILNGTPITPPSP